ncbi:hypothetical protein BDN72DRAFT_848761 [Pluteus cervinus]|uniref:Uncharacterized protein n=1 Tax=Pluteus cervinus TaxID=181527 RepID=A0ACD3A936_9AGAR|nr:hypothetical protein BDN72DRAFT_848761 [Pluteus cervinus]
MAHPVHPSVPVATSPRNLIDLKANGEVSRMRNHKGNMPSLPQTKYCSLCPAKFTRTTHLNRHLRSHTNERLHRCNTCNAEFTRSDLLTRHKRTCGDSANANRSRRKSCQACAESKVKCNLQYPCTKCSARGKDCVFINDPEASRNKRNAKKAQRSASPKSPSDDSTALSALSGASSQPSFSNPTSPLSTISIVTSPSGLETPFPLLPNSSNSTSSGSSNSSPRTDFFETRQDIPNSYDVELDTLTLDTQLNRLFTTSTTSYESYVDQGSTSCTPQATELNWVEGSGTTFYPSYNDEGYTFTGGDQFPGSSVGYANHASPANVTVSTIPSLGLRTSPASPQIGTMPRMVEHAEPTAAELEQYLYSFYSDFLTQVPVLHASTWRLEGKPYYLIRAMQACGALFAKTRPAGHFISETLSSIQDSLIYEAAKNSSDSMENINLLVAIVLVQVLGQLYEKNEHRSSSNILHGMTVTLIRRMGLLNQIGSWIPPDLGDPHSTEIAWRDWIHYETIKRVLFLSYLHDCHRCIYHSITPTYVPEEFDLCLPCDDALWRAETSRAWIDALQTPSMYGAGSTGTRLTGVGMHHAFTMLSMPLEPRIHGTTSPLNPFAQFILIHSILRDLYTIQLDEISTIPAAVGGAAGGSSAAGGTLIPDGSNGTTLNLNQNNHNHNHHHHLPHHAPSHHRSVPAGNGDQVFVTQRALQNWLQAWLANPDTMHLTGQGNPSDIEEDALPYVYNALPYYWLAQASVYAIQATSLQHASAGSEHIHDYNNSSMGHNGNETILGRVFETDVSGEGRTQMVKCWMERIKGFLRDGTQHMGVLWKDLMQIRERVTSEDREARVQNVAAAATGMRGGEFRIVNGNVGAGAEFTQAFPPEGLMGLFP